MEQLRIMRKTPTNVLRGKGLSHVQRMPSLLNCSIILKQQLKCSLVEELTNITVTMQGKCLNVQTYRRVIYHWIRVCYFICSFFHSVSLAKRRVHSYVSCYRDNSISKLVHYNDRTDTAPAYPANKARGNHARRKKRDRTVPLCQKKIW